MDRFRRTNPSVNRIITSRMQKRLHDILQAKIKSVKPTLNLRGLKLKRVRNRKREQMVEDRNIQIDQENKKLLRRMEEIALTPQVDCHLRRRHAQTNYGHRKLHVDAVNRENLLMLKRLQGTRSVYNSAKWEEEREHMLRRIRYMSEYKEDGKPKFFQFGFEPPDDANKSKSGGTGGSRSRSSSRASRGSRTKRSKSGGTRGRRRRRKGSDRDALAHTAPQRAMTAGALGSRAKAEWGGTPEHSKSAVMLPRIATTSHGKRRPPSRSPGKASQVPHSPITHDQQQPVRVLREYNTPRRKPSAHSMATASLYSVDSPGADADGTDRRDAASRSPVHASGGAASGGAAGGGQLSSRSVASEVYDEASPRSTHAEVTHGQGQPSPAQS